MNRLSVAASLIVGLVLIALLGLVVARVGAMLATELDRAGPDTTLAEGVDATLLEADLLAGDHLTFELCSGDGMEPARWLGAMTLSLEAGASEPRDHVLDRPMEASLLAEARRSGAGACVDFAQAGPLQESGHFVVRAVEVRAAMTGVTVRARVVADRPIDSDDRNEVLGILLAAIALVIALALRTPTVQPTPAVTASAARTWITSVGLALLALGLIAMHPQLALATKAILGVVTLAITVGSGLAIRRGVIGGTALLGVVAVVALSTLLSFLPLPGPAFGLMAGLALGLSEVGIALSLVTTFAPLDRLAALGLQRPTRTVVAWAAFVSAPIVGLVLRVLATRVLALVPSTGEAPIETYVSWPSGLLSFAALSAIAPIGEEVFFRGLVYGALRGEGGRTKETLAFLGAWLLFVLAHLPQTWGSWGGLAAVAIAGLGFTTLRALTGSVLVAALAHLVYNGLLAAAALQ